MLPSAAMHKPHSIRRALLGATLLTALVLGCKNESSQASPVASAAATPTAVPSAAAPGLLAPPGSAPSALAPAEAAPAPSAPPGLPQVTIALEDAGAEPKKLLRYRFQKGKTKAFNMKMTLAMSATMDGQLGQPMPPVDFEFSGKSLTVDVASDGSATRQTTFASFTPKMPNLPPQVAAQMEAEMKGLEGVQVIEHISSRGQVQGVEVNQATVQSPQVQQLLNNLIEGMSNSFLPLPEGPVGLGARWTSKSVMAASGVSVTQIGRFKVTSLVGDKVSLELGIEQLADAKSVPAFASAPGMQTQLVSMDGKGTGLTVVDLGSLDSTGTVNIETKTVTRITSADAAAPGQPGAGLPGAAPQPGMPPRSATSTLVAKVGVTIKMTD